MQKKAIIEEQKKTLKLNSTISIITLSVNGLNNPVTGFNLGSIPGQGGSCKPVAQPKVKEEKISQGESKFLRINKNEDTVHLVLRYLMKLIEIYKCLY